MGSSLLTRLTDVRRFAELLGHVKMVVQCRQRLTGPILQIGIVTALDGLKLSSLRGAQLVVVLGAS